MVVRRSFVHGFPGGSRSFGVGLSSRSGSVAEQFRGAAASRGPRRATESQRRSQTNVPRFAIRKPVRQSLAPIRSPSGEPEHATLRRSEARPLVPRAHTLAVRVNQNVLRSAGPRPVRLFPRAHTLAVGRTRTSYASPVGGSSANPSRFGARRQGNQNITACTCSTTFRATTRFAHATASHAPRSSNAPRGMSVRKLTAASVRASFPDHGALTG